MITWLNVDLIPFKIRDESLKKVLNACLKRRVNHVLLFKSAQLQEKLKRLH